MGGAGGGLCPPPICRAVATKVGHGRSWGMGATGIPPGREMTRWTSPPPMPRDPPQFADRQMGTPMARGPPRLCRDRWL